MQGEKTTLRPLQLGAPTNNHSLQQQMTCQTNSAAFKPTAANQHLHTDHTATPTDGPQQLSNNYPAGDGNHPTNHRHGTNHGVGHDNKCTGTVWQTTPLCTSKRAGHRAHACQISSRNHRFIDPHPCTYVPCSRQCLLHSTEPPASYHRPTAAGYPPTAKLLHMSIRIQYRIVQE